ncbi:hypothetical protein Q8A67_012154 [Cirrhinus molitorella]|uniref:UPAR/Ly6 domain-containing protein n=1 Tax=Cirrhinus molitorella TaxID=172907 RepID=A0AA88Q0S5_9TELE|nr:hypothetical protein Q8A67_012154 [Cirrhinus molitorella]
MQCNCADWLIKSSNVGFLGQNEVFHTSFNRTCHHVLSECRPQELCFTADGRFGRASVLFSKGCMQRRDCVRSNSQMIRGNNISFTYACCDRPYCNSSRGCDHSLALLAVTAIAATFITAGFIMDSS